MLIAVIQGGNMSDSINYNSLMNDAMRGLLAAVLKGVIKDGLPGEHHFFITFDTRHPGVEMADWMFDSFPEEMTIVMQEWFDNLEVLDDHFTVTLNFGNNPEPLVIPFQAVLTFVDPSVEFGLRFETVDAPTNIAEVEESPMVEVEVEDDAPTGDAEVVSLDAFRK